MKKIFRKNPQNSLEKGVVIDKNFTEDLSDFLNKFLEEEFKTLEDGLAHQRRLKELVSKYHSSIEVLDNEELQEKIDSLTQEIKKIEESMTEEEKKTTWTKSEKPGFMIPNVSPKAMELDRKRNQIQKFKGQIEKNSK